MQNVEARVVSSTTNTTPLRFLTGKYFVHACAVTCLPSVQQGSEAHAQPWLSGRLREVSINRMGINTITLGPVVAEYLEPSHDGNTHA